ncbi:MAG: hypothetical protein J6O18_10000 [Bacilli bacterium]|nr:hypothetical protein [Bacilli bacterium]
MKTADSLRNMAESFDQSMKDYYLGLMGPKGENDFPYSSKYAHYFKPEMLEAFISTMRPDILAAYRKGSGGELEPKPNGVPPKFLSIASSSRFCYTALDVKEDSKKGYGADFFALPGESIEKVFFEKELAIVPDAKRHPTIDAYACSKDTEYFFECKCHEMFQAHDNYLSSRYFAHPKDLIVKSIPKEYIKEGHRLDSRAFGLENTVFDTKQLLTHLMGIQCNATKKNRILVYYYFFPCRDYISDPKVLTTLDRVLDEAKAIFNSSIVREHCQKHGVRLTLAVKQSGYDDPASEANTTILYQTE